MKFFRVHQGRGFETRNLKFETRAALVVMWFTIRFWILDLE